MVDVKKMMYQIYGTKIIQNQTSYEWDMDH
jgi:hypothetical protein